MKIKKLVIFFMVIFNQLLSSSSIITYKLNGGRFGDSLLTYCKATWIAYKHDLPLLYKPFIYSDQLMLHDLENKEYTEQYLETMYCTDDVIVSRSNIFYVVDFYTKVKDNCWNDPYFINLLRARIKPNKEIHLITIPNDAISVAIHIRRGGEFDKPLLAEACTVSYPLNQQFSDVLWPCKFPPLEFYVNQIIYLRKRFVSKKIYAHIFTDDNNPAKIIKQLRNKIPDVEFGCRLEHNRHDENVIEDFFNMLQFNCLIRSSSSYARIAQYLGNFSIVIYPAKAHWKNLQWICDKVEIVENFSFDSVSVKN